MAKGAPGGKNPKRGGPAYGRGPDRTNDGPKGEGRAPTGWAQDGPRRGPRDQARKGAPDERAQRLAAWASTDPTPPSQRPEPRPDRRPPGPPAPSRKRPPWPDQLEGRNVVLLALEASDRVKEVWIDERARPERKIDTIHEWAKRRSVPVVTVPRSVLDEHGDGDVHNGVIAFAEPLSAPSLQTLLDQLERAGVDPFLLLLDEVQYEQNLGAVLRSAACAGVHAVVVPTRRGAPLSPVVQRIAMGGAEEVPVIREGLLSAAATLRRAGVRMIGAEADGELAAWDADWTGPLAIVLGGEDHGLGQTLRARCDTVVRLPLADGTRVSSLNVSVTAGVLLFQRVRAMAQAR